MTTLRSFVNWIFFGLWTVFMVTLAVTLGAIRRDPGLFKRMQRDWARGLLRFWGVELDIVGEENMTTDRSYVVVSNHLSYVDIVVLFLALPVIPGFLAKRELTRVPFLNQALRSGGHVVIDRQRHASARQTLTLAAEQVRDGKTVLIFPEGTRGESNTVGDFKKGGFHLAKQAGVPILPVGVRGSRDIFPKGSILVRPGRVAVHIGAPIETDEVEAHGPNELSQRARTAIIELSGLPPREGAGQDGWTPASAPEVGP